MYSSVAGIVEKVNKLVSVKPLRTRYNAEIGDVIVGRIIEVGSKRWRVDTNSKQDTVLLLSSINLPGGIQRRKSESDELQMRNFFVEGDILSAEVQTFYADGSNGIHTRNYKYGKLGNGSFVVVPPALVKRSKSHFHTLPCGVQVILGLNGYIWVGMERVITDEDSDMLYSNDFPAPLKDQRQNIARIVNCINGLAKNFCIIDESMIIFCFDASLTYSVKDLLNPEIMSSIVSVAKMHYSQQ